MQIEIFPPNLTNRICLTKTLKKSILVFPLSFNNFADNS